MDKIKQIKKLRDQGKTYQEIAEVFNTSRQWIHQLVPRDGKTPYKYLTPKQRKCAFVMYRKYLNKKEAKVVDQK